MTALSIYNRTIYDLSFLLKVLFFFGPNSLPFLSDGRLDDDLAGGLEVEDSELSPDEGEDPEDEDREDDDLEDDDLD